MASRLPYLFDSIEIRRRPWQSGRTCLACLIVVVTKVGNGKLIGYSKIGKLNALNVIKIRIQQSRIGESVDWCREVVLYTRCHVAITNIAYHMVRCTLASEILASGSRG